MLLASLLHSSHHPSFVLTLDEPLFILKPFSLLLVIQKLGFKRCFAPGTLYFLLVYLFISTPLSSSLLDTPAAMGFLAHSLSYSIFIGLSLSPFPLSFSPFSVLRFLLSWSVGGGGTGFLFSLLYIYTKLFYFLVFFLYFTLFVTLPSCSTTYPPDVLNLVFSLILGTNPLSSGCQSTSSSFESRLCISNLLVSSLRSSSPSPRHPCSLTFRYLYVLPYPRHASPGIYHICCTVQPS